MVEEYGVRYQRFRIMRDEFVIRQTGGKASFDRSADDYIGEYLVHA